ncbi:unnamed protein product [Trifolium pratense]|uniref:Uncharacterized protein n=1 Tax=Trifolium pratense TaxID=57577 RepID=A0ACB0KZN1_TRIPR|nr:unnamed protein product [Trifolium pratense]
MVSHLLFADDCFLFCRSNLDETRHLMRVLKTYEEAAEQEINLSKSEVFFSRNLSLAAQEDLSRIMGVRQVLGTGNYLGLPSMIGRKKRDVFAFIKDRLWKRINSWRGRALSRAGKEVMIKSVLQAIPSYVMSIYLLPDATINEIERMLNSFWWGGSASNQGIRWLAWDRMTIPKAFGGMGFRDLRAFNLAMIAKQAWNFMTKPHSLVARLYKARWIIGSGTNINVMKDPWLREKDGAWIQSPQVQGAYNITVNNLMLPNIKRWDKEKVETLFTDEVAKSILDIPLFDTVEEDKLIWIDNIHGQYSVKSGYNLMMNNTGKLHNTVQPENWKHIWKIHAPPKAKHLLWRICKQCLPTRVHLHERRVPCTLLCPLCDLCNEDDWHILFSCTVSMQARQAAGLELSILNRMQQMSSAKDIILAICEGEDADTAGRFAMLLWVLWNNRNNKVWNDSQETWRNLGHQSRHLWLDWFSMQRFQQGSTPNMQQQHVPTWQKPPTGWFKCNSDAGTNWREGQCSIVEGESLALLEAMKAMEHRRLTHVIFETDSKSVIDAIHNLHVGSSEFSATICNIKHIMLLNQNFVVKFVKRQANMVAHTLARAAISWASCNIFDMLPHCITTLLLNEII